MWVRRGHYICPQPLTEMEALANGLAQPSAHWGVRRKEHCTWSPGPYFKSEFCPSVVGDHAASVTSLSVQSPLELLGCLPGLPQLPLNRDNVDASPDKWEGGDYFSPGWGPSSHSPHFLPGKKKYLDKADSLQGRMQADVAPVWTRAAAGRTPGAGRLMSEAPGAAVLLLTVLPCV